jgi:hypothetical protein
MSRVLLEKLTVAQLVKKFPDIHASMRDSRIFEIDIKENFNSNPITQSGILSDNWFYFTQ